MLTSVILPLIRNFIVTLGFAPAFRNNRTRSDLSSLLSHPSAVGHCIAEHNIGFSSFNKSCLGRMGLISVLGSQRRREMTSAMSVRVSLRTELIASSKICLLSHLGLLVVSLVLILVFSLAAGRVQADYIFPSIQNFLPEYE